MRTSKLIGACLLLTGMVGLAQAQENPDYMKLFNSRSGTYSYFTPTAALPDYAAFNASPAQATLSTGGINAATYMGAAGSVTQFVALLDNPAIDPPLPGQTCVQSPSGACISDILMYVASTTGPPNVALFSDQHGLFSDATIGAIVAAIPVANYVVETGLEMDVSSLILSFGAPLAPGTLYVYSDVPVPGAVWLFGSALGLLGLRRKLS